MAILESLCKYWDDAPARGSLKPEPVKEKKPAIKIKHAEMIFSKLQGKQNISSSNYH